MANFYQDFTAYLKGEDSPITELINSDSKEDAQERMNIYRDAYALRLIDILYGDFPGIYQILGTQAFVQMAKDYLKSYPSTTYTVRYFGQYLSKYLSETTPYCDYPYLWQLADFEWAKGNVFDAPDGDFFTLEQLTDIPPTAWETASFTFIPAMTRLVYDYNIPQIWQAIEDNQQNNEPTALTQPIPWVMWRKALNPHWYSMTEDEDWFFIQARSGKSFTELCEGLSSWHDTKDIPQKAASIVRRWIDEQLLMGIHYD